MKRVVTLNIEVSIYSTMNSPIAVTTSEDLTPTPTPMAPPSAVIPFRQATETAGSNAATSDTP